MLHQQYLQMDDQKLQSKKMTLSPSLTLLKQALASVNSTAQ
jgi:hypothetical protein